MSDKITIDQVVSIRAAATAGGGDALQVPYDRIRKLGAVSGFDCIIRKWSIARKSNDGGTAIVGNRAFLIAACVATFYRYTGQLDIPLAVNLLGRAVTLRNVLLQARISGDMRLSDLEFAIRAALAGAEVSGRYRGPVVVTIADGSTVSNQEADSALHSSVSSDVDQDLVDLHLIFNQSPERVQLDAVFDTCVFDRETVERLTDNLLHVVSAVTMQPDTRLSDLDLPSPVERASLSEFCSGQPLTFAGLTATREFEERARVRSHHTAISFNNCGVTYAEANSRANRIAKYLGEMEVAPGNHVIVCLHPCLELPLVLIALLKMGAVYVPVNPEYPQARIDAIAEDTQATLVISQKAVTDRIRFEGCRVLDVAKLDDQIAGLPADNPLRTVDVKDIAYIYYTSGTTGRPKGVTGSHENLMHMLHSSRARYGINETDTIPAVASFTFSISMFELLSPLTVGGTLLILERRKILDAEEMARVLRSVTFFHIGPSLLKGILKHIKHNAAGPSSYTHVRHASSGGDMVPPEVLNDLRTIFSAAEIFVIYGCSEISLMGCTYEMPQKSITRTYVGKPLANVKLLVLDDDDNQVPIGAVGDVCFGGPGVVPGYLNQPELSRKSFFERNGNRYYRTGDRGRFSSTGLLELLGRRDFQIQIRGMRVEIGDIEYHLRRAPGVRDGVVAMSKSRFAEQKLIAYFVPDSSQTASSASIREHMLTQLPDFMVPAIYIELTALPLNQNLKIDRKALPETATAWSGSTVTRRSPVLETEIALAQIWQELLNVGFVGLDDNFLLLGGDSILAMEMIFHVQQRLGVRLDGMDVLRESLQVLAAICDKARGQRHARSPAGGWSVRSNVVSLESFYFGCENSLYGAYNPPQSYVSATPVLICGPCGHESARCAFFIKQLAAALAAHGIPVLRFNFFGCDDSLGESQDATLQRWYEDITAAVHWLRQKTHSRMIKVLGVRLGAILAAQALARDVEHRLFTWDPLIDVSLCITEQRRMHLEKIEKLLVIRRLRRPAPIAGVEEIVGFCYSSEMIRGLSQLTWQGHFSRPLVTVLSSSAAGERSQTGLAATKNVGDVVIRLPVDCGWYDSTRVTAAITNVSITSAIIEAITVHGNG